MASTMNLHQPAVLEDNGPVLSPHAQEAIAQSPHQPSLNRYVVPSLVETMSELDRKLHST